MKINASIDIDLDGVVYPEFSEVLADYVFDRTRRVYSPVVQSWEFYKEWGIDKERFESYIRGGIKEGIIFGQGMPVEGSVEGLKALDEMGFRIRLVTTRLVWPGLHGPIQTNTAGWLDTHQIPYHSIWYQGKGDNKNTDGWMLLDDRAENVRSHHRGVLYQRPHNKADWDTMSSVAGWEQFIPHVEKHFYRYSRG